MPDDSALHDRAAVPARAGGLRGNLDAVHPDGTIVAWCWLASEPDTRRDVIVYVDGTEVARARCDRRRADLIEAGVGDGCHALEYVLPAAVTPAGRSAAVTLCDAGTGETIGMPIRATWHRAPAAGPAPAQSASPPPAVPRVPPPAGAPRIPSPSGVPRVPAPAVRPAATPPGAPGTNAPVGAPTGDAPAAALTGNIDRVTRDGWVFGWCWRPGRPEERADLTVLVDGEPVGVTRAAVFRPDLKEAGIGDGAYGFALALPWSVLAGKGALSVSVREAATGQPLGEPVLTRAGRLAGAEERIQDLEREVRLLRAQLDEVNRHAQGRDDERATRALFATAAEFFQALAQGETGAAHGAGLKGAVEDLTARLAPIVLAVPAEPAATLCVPATAPVATLHACLQALHEAGVDAAADIVLIDDGALGGEAALLPALVRNLQYARVPAGGTLPATHNEVARQARGKLLGLIAPQIRVAGGWLDELAATFAREPEAAAVSAKVVDDAGLLYHTGLTAAADGRLRDPGQCAAADDPAHDFLRPVHAIGHLALLIRRDRLAEVGGFAGGYASLAHAVPDLCLRLRARGHAVLYQPVARAAWSGDDSAAALPDLDLPDEDARLLRLRWEASAQSASRNDPRPVGHALVIDTTIPRPDRDAGSVATLEQMRLLRRLGYQVTFAAAGGDEMAPEEAASLRRQGIELVVPPHYRSATHYLETHGASLDLVQIYRHMNATLFLDRVQELAPQAKIVFSPADLHHLREARGAHLRGGGDSPDPELRAQELECMRRSHATIVVSDFERDLLARDINPARLHLLRWIAHPHPSARRFAERRGLCFVGSFRHDPNADGVLWFAAEILPLIRAELPDLVFHVAGSDMPERIQALASDAITVHGWVPDLASLFDTVRLSVAPLRYGAGFKGKVATSLAHGLPVVGTATAFEGTGLAAGEGCAIADDPAAFAAAVVRLHENEAAWTGQAAKAITRCRDLYSPEAARAVYRRLCMGLGLPVRAE